MNPSGDFRKQQLILSKFVVIIWIIFCADLKQKSISDGCNEPYAVFIFHNLIF